MKKILILDDDQAIRDLIKERLTQNKYAVMTAADGNEALIIAKTSQPDLILLDIAMLQMDGYATCEKLKQDAETQDIPVLFLTGKDLKPQGILQRCQNLGASGYISKLSTLKELLKKIEEVIGVALILFFLFLSLNQNTICFAQTTPGQIQRSQEILEEERTLRAKLEKEEKVYIKKITVKGATLLNEKQIREIILPFQKHWLNQNDIQQILALIERSYINNGYASKLKGISYQVKKRILEIRIEEVDY